MSNYNLTPEFEAQVIWFLVNSSKFWGLFGEVFDAEALSDGPAKQLVECCKSIYAERQKPPGGTAVVIQRLVTQAKLKQSEVEEIKKYLDKARQAEISEEDIIFELTPIIRRQAELKAIKLATESFVKKEGLDEAVKAMGKASRIGESFDDPGDTLDGSAFDILAAVGKTKHLETGIPQLDELVRGLPQACIGLWVGGTGAGKSMALSQVAANAWAWGLSVCYASLELPRAAVLVRLLAAALRRPIAEVQAAATGGPGASSIIEETKLLHQAGGYLQVQYFAPSVTEPATLFEWVAQREAASGRKVDLLVIDYADRLGAPGNKMRRGDGDYHAARLIYEQFQEYVERKETRIWTASQVRRNAGKRGKEARFTGRLVDLDDIADSTHKTKASDLVITITPEDKFSEDGDLLEQENARQVTLLVAKYRYGSGRKQVGPLATSFETGRLVDTGTVLPIRMEIEDEI